MQLEGANFKQLATFSLQTWLRSLKQKLDTLRKEQENDLILPQSVFCVSLTLKMGAVSLLNLHETHHCFYYAEAGHKLSPIQGDGVPILSHLVLCRWEKIVILYALCILTPISSCLIKESTLFMVKYLLNLELLWIVGGFASVSLLLYNSNINTFSKQMLWIFALYIGHSLTALDEFPSWKITSLLY